MIGIDNIITLTSDERLAEALERACGKQSRDCIAAGVFHGDASAFAITGESSGTADARSFRNPLGCITKALTAALVSQLIVDGVFAVDTAVCDLIHPSDGDKPALQGITVRHLLNHTHGLDLSALHAVPYTDAGYIDVGALCSWASRTRRLFEPGEFYSYGSAGSWFAAAVLERHWQQPYSQLLVTRLLQPMGIRLPPGPQQAQRFCPAAGADLSMSMKDAVTLLQWQVSGDDANADLAVGRGIIPGPPVPLPGWGLEQGMCLGWKSYGEGWFGHNSLTADTSMSVRFHIGSRIGMVTSAASRSSAVVLARLLGNSLPGFTQFNLPRALPLGADNAVDFNACVGRFENAATLAVIEQPAPMKCTLTLFNKVGAGLSGEILRSQAQPCSQQAFMLEPKAAAFGAWIQFVQPSTNGYGYLWNGRELLRRSAA